MSTENGIVDNNEQVVSNSEPKAPKRAERGKEQRTDMYKVRFEDLVIADGENIREDMGDIKGLAASIRENGIKVPLSGYREDGKWVIVAGHRRYEAVKLLNSEGLTDIVIPILPASRGKLSSEQFIIDTILTNSGKDLTPLELADGVEKLVDRDGWEEGDLAVKLGKDRTYIQRLYKLAKAPAKFKNLVKRGTVSSTLAMKIMQGGADSVEQFLADIDAGVYTKDGEGVYRITAKDMKEKKQSNAKGGGGESLEDEEDDGDPVVKKPSSQKELNHYLSEVPMTDLSTKATISPKDLYDFLWKVREDKASPNVIAKFFGVKL